MSLVRIQPGVQLLLKEMEKGKWLDYDPKSMTLNDNDMVLIRRRGYGNNIDLCRYNEMFKCFDDGDGDDYFCELESTDKIFIIPEII